MNKKILSICIPTYNRSKYLRQCLDSIVLQFKNENVYEKTEVIISDNASSDNTKEVVETFQKKYSNIKYFRFEKNLGVDRNILNIIEKSEAEYCVTIGDDDAFFPGSIEYMIDAIKNSHTPYYILNGWGYDHELEHPILPHPNFPNKKNIYYPTLSDYVYTIKAYTSLVGAFCGLSHLFRRKDWIDFKDKEKYVGTHAIHFFIILSVFKNAESLFLSEPVIKTRSSNIRWNVFPGLGTIKGRIDSTITLAKWVRDEYNLPISNIKLTLYFYFRENWFTFKEIAKRILSRAGLSIVIIFYQKIRKILK